MGNGLPRTPLDWRIVKHEVSYKQLLRDVRYANQLWSTALHLRQPPLHATAPTKDSEGERLCADVVVTMSGCVLAVVFCSGHSFVDERTGLSLRFDCVTNVERHELLPLLWRLEGKLLVIARTEKVTPLSSLVQLPR